MATLAGTRSLPESVHEARGAILRQEAPHAMFEAVCRALTEATVIDAARIAVFPRPGMLAKTAVVAAAGERAAELRDARGLAIDHCDALKVGKPVRNSRVLQVCRRCPLMTANPDRAAVVVPIQGNRVSRPLGTLGVDLARSQLDERGSLDLLAELGQDLAIGLQRLEAEKQSASLATLLRRYSEQVPGFLFQLRRQPDGSSSAPFVSASVVNWLGRTPEELARHGEYLYERIHPDDLGLVRHSIQAAYDALTAWSFEFRIVLDDLSERWISAHAAPEQEPDGSVLWHGHAFDVTYRLGAERELARLTERAQLAALASGVGIWEYDAVTNRFLWDAQMYCIHGISPEDFSGKPIDWMKLLHPDDQVPVNDRFVQALEEGSDFRVEFRVIRADGATRYVSSQAIAEVDLKGKVQRLVGTNRDVTDEALGELALRESEERFRTLFENVPAIAVQGYDAAGVVAYWNRASERLYGYTAEEALGRTMMELLVPAELREMTAAAIRESAGTGVAIEPAERELVCRNGRRVPVYSCHAVVSPPGHPETLYCLDVDLTAYKQLETELRQAQKLESIGLLAGGIAHDFNNLLAAILGNIGLARDGLFETGGELEGHLLEIEGAAERAATLTRQLLVIGRQEQIAPRSVNLNDLAGGLLVLLRRTLGERWSLAFEPAEGNVVVRVDPGQIEQVLINLCVNARDAMASGGPIRLETVERNFDETTRQSHPWARPGRFAGIRVRDEGCGIDPQSLDQVFEPFFSTKAVGRGTGLGLSIVYGIVQQHQGLVHIESKPDRGTTVSVYFPLSDEQPVELELPGERLAPAPGGCEHILIAEDEAVVLRLARRILERGGYRVTASADGQAAMDLLADGQERFHLLLADVVMPRAGGAELAEYVRDRGLTLPIIFMSGYAGGADQDVRLAALGAARLDKPFRAESLLRCVRDVLDGQVSARSR